MLEGDGSLLRRHLENIQLVRSPFSWVPALEDHKNAIGNPVVSDGHAHDASNAVIGKNFEIVMGEVERLALQGKIRNSYGFIFETGNGSRWELPGSAQSQRRDVRLGIFMRHHRRCRSVRSDDQATSRSQGSAQTINCSLQQSVPVQGRMQFANYLARPALPVQL